MICLTISRNTNKLLAAISYFWYFSFLFCVIFTAEVWCKTDCLLDEGLTLETSAIYQTARVKNIPYQALFIILIQLSRQSRKTFCSIPVFKSFKHTWSYSKLAQTRHSNKKRRSVIYQSILDFPCVHSIVPFSNVYMGDERGVNPVEKRHVFVTLE